MTLYKLAENPDSAAAPPVVSPALQPQAHPAKLKPSAPPQLTQATTPQFYKASCDVGRFVDSNTFGNGVLGAIRGSAVGGLVGMVTAPTYRQNSGVSPEEHRKAVRARNLKAMLLGGTIGGLTGGLTGYHDDVRNALDEMDWAAQQAGSAGRIRVQQARNSFRTTMEEVKKRVEDFWNDYNDPRKRNTRGTYSYSGGEYTDPWYTNVPAGDWGSIFAKHLQGVNTKLDNELQDPAVVAKVQTFMDTIGTPNATHEQLTKLMESFPEGSRVRQVFNILLRRHVKTAAIRETYALFGLGYT